MNKHYLILLSLVMFCCMSCSLMVEQQPNNAQYSGNTKQHSTNTAVANNNALTPKAIQACKNKGGEIKKAGLSQMPHCVITYQDAGKPCKNASECTGSCLLIEKTVPAGMPVAGECQHNNLVFGCYAEVEGGVAGLTLCID